MCFPFSSPQDAFAAKYLMPTAAHPIAFAESASNRRAFEAPSIRLLDDDLSMLKALDRLLKSEGFNVERFSDPAAFLSRMGSAPCRLAILDVWMPDMNGLEVQSALRKHSPDTRIIFISGRDDPSVRQTALDAGAFGFLSKPFDDEALLQLVRKAVA
jgi:FixJ family two-component response regulator